MNKEKLSQRSIARRYASLTITPADENHVNCYWCSSCQTITKTIDIHKGTTPMLLTCPNCGYDQASSSWYNDIAPSIKPTYEWFVPTLKECLKMANKPNLLEHIFMGGLEIRKINQ